MSSTSGAEVSVPIDDFTLSGTLTITANCRGVVVFAHGSGSSRLSPRNVAVANALVDHGCGTLLFDLLTEAEAADRGNVFDIALLGSRVVSATRWLKLQDEARGLPIGYFGASTGAAAALVAAAQLGDTVAAVVSRGGRPDLAGAALPQVIAPTLLIVGSLDHAVLDLNRSAQEKLNCENKLVIVDGATHLFEEPGKLSYVAQQAGSWCIEKFTG